MRRRFLAALVVFYAALVVLLIVAPQVLAKRAVTPPATTATTCTGTLTHQTTAGITVPIGAVCRVSASTVNGSVNVQRDAYFEAWDTKISGTVNATGALTVFLHDGTSVKAGVQVEGTAQLFLYKTSVGGSVRVTRAVAPGFGHVQVCDTTAGGIEVVASGPDVLVGDPQGGCPGNRVAKDLWIVGNDTKSELNISGNIVAGSLIVTANTGPASKHVMNNTVQGRVDLADNVAPFDSSNNGAAAG
jgi:hypothetical protein